MSLFDIVSNRFASRVRLGLCMTLLTGGLFAAPAKPVAAAATFTVNTTTDLVDFNPGDGICSDRPEMPDSPEYCSLRGAIMEANALPGQDTIMLPTGKFTLTQPVGLQIKDALVIEGASMNDTIIDGGAIDSVFFVNAEGKNVNLSKMTLRNGATQYMGGGLALYGGDVQLNQIAVVDNSARNAGGIYLSSGTLSIIDSLVSGNKATKEYNLIGGVQIVPAASATIARTTIHGNIGSGLYHEGSVVLTNSTISGNTADVNGSGIRSYASLKATNVTISGNSAKQYAAMTINCGANVSLQNVTIANNKSESSGAVYVGPCGIVNVANSIIAGNTNANGPADCSGTLVSSGYNLIGSTTGCTLTGTTTGNLLNVKPGLGPLQANGGRTKTHALPADSKAVDAANPATQGKDQRAQSRPIDGNNDGTARADIGAYEFAGPQITSLAPTTQTVGSAPFVLTVTGKNFTAKSTVFLNNQPRVTEFVDATTLKAQITADDLKTTQQAGVRVGTSGATLNSGISNRSVVAVVNPAPVVTSLTPASAKVGSVSFTMVVKGTGFVSGSKVRWNGANRTTTFMSATELKVVIGASDLAKAGTANVTVATAAPGGGVSAAKPFTITP